LESFKECDCSRKTLLQGQFAPQMWAARPHLASIFEKLLEQKTFLCLRLIIVTNLKNDLLRKCGLLAHTSPTFLKNCWIKKLLPAARFLQPLSNKFAAVDAVTKGG